MIVDPLILSVVVIGIALAFDFTNGFHDAANSIATVVATGVLKPRLAVALAAFFNFSAAVVMGVAVANTISKIVNLKLIDANIIPVLVLAGLIGAISWNVITWYFGLPSSSSHALMGGLGGAGIAVAGLAAINVTTAITIVEYMILSPLIGLAIGFVFMAVILNLTQNIENHKGDSVFKKLQLLSSSAFSFAHGSNDAQKTMGVIVPILFSMGYFGASADPAHLPVPLWVILAAHSAIAIGTLCGGWRIIHTLGYKLTHLKPMHGFAAETAGTSTIIAASFAGIPVSTTHVIASSILGVGATAGIKTVKWKVVNQMLVAWILTLPISAAVGFAAFELLKPLLI